MLLNWISSISLGYLLVFLLLPISSVFVGKVLSGNDKKISFTTAIKIFLLIFVGSVVLSFVVFLLGVIITDVHYSSCFDGNGNLICTQTALDIQELIWNYKAIVLYSAYIIFSFWIVRKITRHKNI